MRRHRLAALLVVLILLSITSGAINAQDAQPQSTEEVQPLAPATATPPPTAAQPAATATQSSSVLAATYVVQPGENLYRIALRFRTTVAALAQANGIVNPSLIFAGQTIRIPGVGPVPSTPTAPPVPTAGPTSTGTLVTATTAPTATPTSTTGTTTYVVQAGDNLARIALRNNTTVARLVALNNISNPNLIYIGQRLTIPGPGQGGGPVSTAEVAPATEEVASIAIENVEFGYGIEAALAGQEATLAEQIAGLGMGWAKQEVSWRDLESTEGQIDFTTLDGIVDALEAQKLSILFTVTNAPDWARTSHEEDGPPDDFADFGAFVTALAQRYAGRVQAYEIWSEPNLRREWNSTAHQISAVSYVELLRQGYNAVKAADPAAIVVSAGLAPTGFNDGVNAINDRIFLSGLYAGGLAGLSDAVGAHPGGWANPPDATCCTASEGVTTHFEDPSFYFLDTLNDYREIMVQNNDASTSLWVTEFGWGTSEDTDPPSQTYIFVSYTDLDEQATYIPQGFALGAELGFVGPMFLYNLNGCEPGSYFSSEACYFSLLGPDGQARPALTAVQSIDKSGDAPAAETPTATLIFAPTFTPTSAGAAPVIQEPSTEIAMTPTTEATAAAPAPLPTDVPLDSQPAATQEPAP